MAPPDQLVGRVTELAALEAAITTVADGNAGVLSVVGAPGIGKSRLLAELADRAGAKGQLVLTGSASELERDLPFGVFVDALDEYVESLDPRRLERLEEDVRVELARVIPALSGFHRDGANAPQDERYRTHRAVRTLLETLATKPLVLVLDDFHWADPASIELAGALLRRPPAGPVLMVLGIRPRQLPDRLSGELGRAQRGGTLTQLELTPLSLDDARALLGDAMAPAASQALYEESGGVPFYLEQLARVSNGNARPAAAPAAPVMLGGADVPPLVVAALSEELALLSDVARRVLQGAAVAGDPFEPELAAAAAEVSEPEAVEALDELFGLDFIRSTDVPRRFRFRHPLVRRAVYESTPGGWRLTAHERTAEALAARGASAGACAHHVEASARQGNTGAVALLREAGEQAAGRAPASAARWFGGAIRLLPDSAPAEERVELLLPRAQALAALGQLRESHDALVESLDLAPATSPELRARLTTACARVERYLGHHERASERLASALGDVAPQSPAAVAIVIELALDGFYRLEFEAMHAWAARAVIDADVLADPALRAAAYAMSTIASAWTGDVEQAEAARATAVPLVENLTDSELATRLDAAANLAAAELYLDRFPEAARHAERAFAVGRATGQSELFPALYAILGTTWSMEGRLTEAADLLDGAVEAARLLDDAQGLAWTLFNRSMVAMCLGDVDGTLDTARESVKLSANFEPGLVTAWAGVWLAKGLLESGDPAQAVELMLTSAGGEELELIPGGWRVWCLETLTQARVVLGDVDAARRTSDAAAMVAAHVGLPFAGSMADRARARVALADGDPAAAADLALSSVAQAESAGARIEAELSRTLAGQALGKAGERKRAVEQLARAADDLGRFGAMRYRDAADQELRRIGERVQRRSGATRAGGSGFDSLTDRELEIARLTVDRLTNREIAGRLFLSEKTIESHMRNVFIKLGVSSRVEVARATERADRR